MKLTDIHLEFKTDKGTAHSYINFYDDVFDKLRLEKLNFLEIGVLFGGSLKMWHKYFEHSIIYGIEDFSQKDGQGYYNKMPINSSFVIEDLSKYNRIKLLVFNCESVSEIKKNLKDIKFDIIIDDASHKFLQQINNLKNYSKFLNSDGIYICEDIQSKSEGDYLKSCAKEMYPHKNVELFEFNISKKNDDRLLIIN